MTTIWKFPVPMQHEFTLKVPYGAQVLTVQMQNGSPMLWASCESDAPREERRFIIAGTGRFLPEKIGRYVGTWQDIGYVWHLFEETWVGSALGSGSAQPARRA